jgi:hypothetical protein
MTEQLLGLLEKAGHAISLIAVVVIVGGFILAAVRYARRYRGTSLEIEGRWPWQSSPEPQGEQNHA